MIKISGTVQRAFIFPAVPEIVLNYYSELIRVAQFMPHISLVHIYAPNQIRALYESVELGSYAISIYTDLEGAVSFTDKSISVYPVKIPTAAPIESRATMRQTVGFGLFAIDAQLYPLNDHTRLEATLRLQATLDRPRGMKMMPKRIVNRITQGITDNRIREMADGFIKASIEGFPEWQAAHQPLAET